MTMEGSGSRKFGCGIDANDHLGGGVNMAFGHYLFREKESSVH